MPHLPSPNYERDVNRLISYYKKAFLVVSQQLRVIPQLRTIEKAQAEALLGQIMFTLRELDNSTKNWSDDVIRKTFTEAQARTVLTLGAASTLSEAASSVSFSLLARERVEALINDTYSDLLMATQNTERKVKRLVRNTVGEAMRMKAIEQLGRRTTKKAIVAELTLQGLSRQLQSDAWVGIVDKAGRRWKLSTYAEMVVRTKLTQAHIEGVRVETLERGVDLAVISSHGAKDACSSYEGMIISLHGLTKGYLTYEEVRATGKIFHPNCQHHVSPVRDVNLLPSTLRDKHEEKRKQLQQRRN
ncbi:phage minor capsid protein [Heliorestis convoluta]|uniref:Phage minor capsid 2 family protein n=1 Tax=Heliorestis convoluta TaxID=356322 RepID=A0A5Q2N200_9FIRM|nr:phage minor capsid protein [Heliorestis convoluta]QGG47646.1 phage minor capsid 2 family protein [Heliorestis convoluta]